VDTRFFVAPKAAEIAESLLIAINSPYEARSVLALHRRERKRFFADSGYAIILKPMVALLRISFLPN
jgi:hypothetical protein